MDKKRKPELLVPASSLEVLRTAVIFGADAVYIGGEAFGLRAKAKNFTPGEMKQGIDFAHEHGVRVHVTANILAHNADLKGAEDYFRELKELKPDALIIADPGMFTIAKEICPEIDIHISTQVNNTNYRTYDFWYRQGAKRVVSARELSLKEIKEIREHIPGDLEIESFIHGAMCISYSGRCLLSSFLTGRDANRGACTHPCRWKYTLMEETRPGEYMPVIENDRGTFIFNSKDLCMIEHIPEMIDAGIDSFKIEGRMKTALYVATVARTYRKAIDDYFESEQKYRGNMDWYRHEIGQCTYRQFTTGFYFGKPDENTQIYDNSTYVRDAVYLGMVEDICGYGADKAPVSIQIREEDSNPDNCQGEDKYVVGAGYDDSIQENSVCQTIVLRQKNKFCTGDEIEIMKPDGRDIRVRVAHISDEEGNPMESAPHAGQKLYVTFEPVAASEDWRCEKYDILRTEKV